MYIAAFIVFLAAGSVFGQYQPWQLPPNVELPGERFIRLIVPKYSSENRTLSQVFQDLSQQYGVRFGIQVTADNQSWDVPVLVEAKNESFRELIDQILRASGFQHASWQVDSRLPNYFEVQLGRVSHTTPLGLRLTEWEAPEDNYPEAVLVNILRLIPELRSRFYDTSGGVIGSASPFVSSGCQLVYRVGGPYGQTVHEVVKTISGFANKSWLFVHYPSDEKRSRFTVF